MDRLLILMIALVEAKLKDVGDQTLMRGLATAFLIVRPRSAPFLLRASALLPATKRLRGISSAVVPPPPMPDDERCLDQSGCTCLETAQMKYAYAEPELERVLGLLG